MAWNPFKAIGNAVGRIFGRGEATPTSQPEQPPAPEPQRQPEQSPVQERRGGLAGFWDKITGAERRQEEAERERQLEERERQLEERQRQIEEREQQIEVREQAVSPTPSPPPQEAAPERELPKFAGGGVSDHLEQDERAFGADSEIVRAIEEAVADFIADRGGLEGLSVDAQEWLQSPTVSAPFGDYWQSGGFTADQVLDGMTNIRNIEISEGEDGEIHVEFDYDADVDGYEVHGHAST